MKVKIHDRDNDSKDTLILSFNDFIVDQCIEISPYCIVGVDYNNKKVVNLELLNYSKNKKLANKLLLDNGRCTLDEDDVVFYVITDFIAWFNLKDINEHYTVCKLYTAKQYIEYDLVKRFIQEEVDLTIKYMD